MELSQKRGIYFKNSASNLEETIKLVDLQRQKNPQIGESEFFFLEYDSMW